MASVTPSKTALSSLWATTRRKRIVWRVENGNTSGVRWATPQYSAANGFECVRKISKALRADDRVSGQSRGGTDDVFIVHILAPVWELRRRLVTRRDHDRAQPARLQNEVEVPYWLLFGRRPGSAQAREQATTGGAAEGGKGQKGERTLYRLRISAQRQDGLS